MIKVTEMTEAQIVAALREARKATLWLMKHDAERHGSDASSFGDLVLDVGETLRLLLGELNDDLRMSADGAPGTPLFASRRVS